MYNVVFENDNGKKYYFGTNNGTVFDMDLSSGISVDLGTSQGFSQIGETVETQTVDGRTISVNGVLYGNIPARKRVMRNVLAPFSSGTLVFEDKYYTRVFVKDAPTFSMVGNNGKFSMRFFAPYPFFYSKDGEEVINIGAEIIPMFHFPINYATPHQFGRRETRGKVNVYNGGDIKVPFSLNISSLGTSTDVTLSNLLTFKQLKINGAINVGEEMHIYRDENGILRCTMTRDGITSDAISRIDESSTLFDLDVGDNFLSVTDAELSENLDVILTFKPAVVSLYEY